MINDTHRALHIILAQRVWQAGSGLITILMIASCLDATQQGWYFSLLSLAAFYTLFDFGLSIVLLQAAAPIFIGARWESRGAFRGELSQRFDAIVAWSARHYIKLAIVFAAILLPAGFVFFFQKTSPGVSWEGPWLVLAVASAMMMMFLPFLAIVEGSGRVGEVYAVRLVQGVVGATTGWLILIAGGGLWAVIAPPLAAVLVQGIWLGRRPALLRSAWLGDHGSIDWRNEFWPHQWQLGLGLSGGYLLTQIYAPLLFITQNATVAGQFGLTITMSNMLGLLALSWVTRHVPVMAKAVANRERSEFDALCRRDLLLSSLAYVSGAATLCVLHRLIEGTSYAGRVLPFWAFVAVLASGLLGHVQTIMAAQLRSFGHEPLLWHMLAGAALMVVGAVWGALYYAATGIVVAMLLTQFILMPVSFRVWRKSIDRHPRFEKEPISQ